MTSGGINKWWLTCLDSHTDTVSWTLQRRVARLCSPGRKGNPAMSLFPVPRWPGRKLWIHVVVREPICWVCLSRTISTPKPVRLINYVLLVLHLLQLLVSSPPMSKVTDFMLDVLDSASTRSNALIWEERFPTHTFVTCRMIKTAIIINLAGLQNF